MTTASTPFLGSLAQGLLQPYVYYGIVLVAIWFVCAKLLLRWGSFVGRRLRSLMLVLPLAVPAIALLASYLVGYIERLGAVAGSTQMQDLDAFAATPAAYFRSIQAPMPSLTVDPAFILTLLGGVALLAGGAVFVATLLFGGRLARRAFRVVLMEDEDYPQVQARVNHISSLLDMEVPKVGLVEDLRPNAFSLGRGKEATIVFSLGILGILEGDELDAVISHELAHLKGGDSAFKALTNALVAISFFNPLSYFAASAALKEREMLADERAASVLAHPHALASALVKVSLSLKSFPSEGRLMKLAALTFLVSSLESKSVARHPSIEARARNVLSLGSRMEMPRRRLAAAFVVCAFIVVAGTAASLFSVNLQTQMLQGMLPKAPLPFTYASTPGMGSMNLRLAHPSSQGMLPHIAHHIPGGDAGVRMAEQAKTRFVHLIDHI